MKTGTLVLTALFLCVACETPLPPVSCGEGLIAAFVEHTSTATTCFEDPNGDVLTYAAASTNPNVAQVTLSGTTLSVTGIAPGSTTATVTATDPGGLEGTATFPVTVRYALEGAISSCAGVTDGLFAYVEIEGVVRANTGLSGVQVFGYMGGLLVGSQLLGSMGTSETRNYFVAGTISLPQNTFCEITATYTITGADVSDAAGATVLPEAGKPGSLR